MLLISYNAQDSPSKKELSNPNCPKNRVWKPLICWTWSVSAWGIGRTCIGVLIGGKKCKFLGLRVFWMNTFLRETKIIIARAVVQGNGIVRPERWRPWALNVNATQSCFDVGARAPTPGWNLLACSPHTPWPPCTISLSSCSFEVYASLGEYIICKLYLSIFNFKKTVCKLYFICICDYCFCLYLRNCKHCLFL